eukprot:TRINITY_DN7197_c0_g1_i6.p1 TRINITY_DN7197_c0_g1~~TRINITY_DN7197_c0_g1_i6.p1  ORF type:complete len:149 (-),score=17.85 TRINITY_DN7197_c0_g1_i6:39-485(-)
MIFFPFCSATLHSFAQPYINLGATFSSSPSIIDFLLSTTSFLSYNSAPLYSSMARAASSGFSYSTSAVPLELPISSQWIPHFFSGPIAENSTYVLRYTTLRSALVTSASKFSTFSCVASASFLPDSFISSLSTPVSYTHLTLPTICSV